MNHEAREYGFTIVELMLAMSFVAALLLAIAMIVIQIANIYNRGITYIDVNQAGSSIASELQRSIAGTTPFPVTDSGSFYVSQIFGGRLCTGKYSYIWNYGSVLQPLSSPRNVYSGGSTLPDIRFVKVLDTDKKYCPPTSTVEIDPTNAVELLDVGQHNLAIHSFSITSSAADTATGQQMYNIVFTLGTNDLAALTSDKNGCKPPSESGSDPAYCAVNQFNIIVRAGNADE